MDIRDLRQRIAALMQPPNWAPVRLAAERAANRTNTQLTAARQPARVKIIASGNKIQGVVSGRAPGAIESPASLLRRNLAAELPKAAEEMAKQIGGRL